MIERLRVTNFLGVRHFNEALGPCTLFVGGNAAGKTGLLQSIVFALTGTLPRVSLKKHAQDVVSDGAKKGDVELFFTADSALHRSLPSGDLTGEPAAFHQTPPLPLVLNAAGFADLTATERRKVLADITGATPDRVWVGDRLAEEGVPLPIIERTLPLLRTGFDAASTSAGANCSAARGEWKGVTGENYGSQKAEGWTAPRPPTPPSLDDLALEHADTERRLLKARAALTRANQAARLGAVPTQADVEAEEAKLAKAEKKLAELRGEQMAATAAAAATPGGTQCPCPECGATVVIDRGTLRKYVATAPAQVEEKRETAAELARRVADGEKKVGEQRTKVSQLRATRTAAAALAGDEDGQPAAEEDAEILQADILVLEQDMALHRMKIRQAEQDHDALRNAADLEARAKAAHEAVGHWDRVAKLLGPDGLPAELLVRALGPFRELLHDRPGSWPEVTLGDDCEIRLNGRGYFLCSESERWRADAVCTLALARLAAQPLVLLDRLDVLEPAARGEALDWLADVAHGGGPQIIAAATLKAAPSIDGVTALWVGEAAPAAAKAA